MPLIVNEPLTIPLLEMLHVDAVTMLGNGVLAIAQEALESAGANPLPVTVTVVLTGPELGVNVMVGVALVTVNLA